MPYGYGSANRRGPSGPAGGASAGGNYGGNRNPQQTYGRRSTPVTTAKGPPSILSRPTPTVTTGGGITGINNRNILNWLKSKAGKYTGYTQHNINNQKLRNALDAGEITEEQYKLMGGYDVAQNMPSFQLGPIKIGGTSGDVGAASLLYNAIKSGINIVDPSNVDAQYGRFAAPESIALNMQEATGLGKKNQMMYADITGGKKFFKNENEMYNMASGGRASYFDGGLLSLWPR